MNNNCLSDLIHPIYIPGLEIPGNIFLAPMAGYTDAPFRSVCLDNGACFAYTEMVSAEACYRKHEKTFKLLQKANNESHFGIQIFARAPESAGQAIKEIIPFRPSIIDLNCGCSIPKILKSGAGAMLLKTPDKIKEIVHAIKNETDIPVSIKIRSGWDPNAVNFLEIAEKAVEAGASMITLHPRTRSQLFKGKADWEQIKTLKTHIQSIPVIGSGDLFTAQDVKNMLIETGCDGVMIARGALGNPFIFRQVKELILKDNAHLTITDRDILHTALHHLKMAIRLKGEKRACTEMRKVFCAYTKGLPYSAVIRQELVHASTYDTYEKLIGGYLAEREAEAQGNED